MSKLSADLVDPSDKVVQLAKDGAAAVVKTNTLLRAVRTDPAEKTNAGPPP